MATTNNVAAATPSSTYTYTPTTDASKASTGAAANAANDPATAQDRFLKLLVAQLTNQDPMNPMDNAQMTSQIAQINTVTGIEKLNATMKNMSTQFSGMQVLQAGNLVGHNVVVTGDKLAFAADGKTATGALELDAAATSVQVQVVTPAGRVIDTLSLGALPAGQHGFNIDSSAYPADTELTFKVTAMNGTNTVTATTLMQDKVTAVGSNADGLTLTLQAAGVKPYASVRSVL